MLNTIYTTTTQIPGIPSSFGRQLITFDRLNAALARVVRELDHKGLWNQRLEAVEVRLVPDSWDCYGWQWYGGRGAGAADGERRRRPPGERHLGK